MTLNAHRKYQWGHDRRFNAYSNYFKKLFGGRVQKISINAGFTCPNRDGTKGTGGCTFCNNSAFSPSYCLETNSITSQIEKGINFHSRRYRKSVAYLGYFQSFTNTYSDINSLKKKYEEALGYPGITGLIIGTRPDCIDDKLLDYLKKLSEDYYLAIEFGVESCYDETLKRINRGHDFDCSVNAIRKTSEHGINCGAHFIFGLPGETRDMMMAEAKIISELPLKSVKFHQLQILKETRMENEYHNKPEDFELFSWEEYRDFFIEFLENLNPSLIVERFTGESKPDLIVNKTWGNMRSEEMTRLIEERMEELDTWQGRLYKSNRNPEAK